MASEGRVVLNKRYKELNFYRKAALLVLVKQVSSNSLNTRTIVSYFTSCSRVAYFITAMTFLVEYGVRSAQLLT